MRNVDAWVPTKFVFRNGRLRGSRDRREVAVGSRLVSNVVAKLYSTYLPQYARGRLVDLGCGKVPLFAAYRDYVSDTVCVDWSGTRHQSNHLDYECDLAERLPFADAEFDTIILSDVLEHIATPERLWSEMSRILRPGGVAFVNTPFMYWLHEEPHDYYRYTRFALQRFAANAQFEVVVLDPMGGALEVVTDVFAKHLAAVPLIGGALSIAVQAAAAGAARVFGGAAARKSAGKFPYGYFMVARRMPAHP